MVQPAWQLVEMKLEFKRMLICWEKQGFWRAAAASRGGTACMAVVKREVLADILSSSYEPG